MHAYFTCHPPLFFPLSPLPYHHCSVPKMMKTSLVPLLTQPLLTVSWSSLMPAPSLPQEVTASKERAQRTRRITSAVVWCTWTYPTSTLCGTVWTGCTMPASPLRTTAGSRWLSQLRGSTTSVLFSRCEGVGTQLQLLVMPLWDLQFSS